MADVVVIATSPAIDRIALAAGPVREGIVSTETFLETPGGKGTHVAMVARTLGVDVALVAPIGGLPGKLYTELLRSEQVHSDLVGVSAPTRGTYTLVDPERADIFEIHEPAVELDAAEAETIVRRAAAAFAGARVAVIAGGLPRSTSPDLHAQLVNAARAAGAACIVDTSSAEALRRALRAGADIAIPNLAEANETAGAAVAADAPAPELARLARGLLEQGGSAIVLTIGGRGSIIVDAEGGEWHVSAPVQRRARNAVGCGDALVAGVAAGLVEGRSLPGAVALGAAAAADKLSQLHSGRVDPQVVRRIVSHVEVCELG